MVDGHSIDIDTMMIMIMIITCVKVMEPVTPEPPSCCNVHTPMIPYTI